MLGTGAAALASLLLLSTPTGAVGNTIAQPVFVADYGDISATHANPDGTEIVNRSWVNFSVKNPAGSCSGIPCTGSLDFVSFTIPSVYDLSNAVGDHKGYPETWTPTLEVDPENGREMVNFTLTNGIPSTPAAQVKYFTLYLVRTGTFSTSGSSDVGHQWTVRTGDIDGATDALRDGATGTVTTTPRRLGFNVTSNTPDFPVSQVPRLITFTVEIPDLVADKYSGGIVRLDFVAPSGLRLSTDDGRHVKPAGWQYNDTESDTTHAVFTTSGSDIARGATLTIGVNVSSVFTVPGVDTDLQWQVLAGYRMRNWFHPTAEAPERFNTTTPNTTRIRVLTTDSVSVFTPANVASDHEASAGQTIGIRAVVRNSGSADRTVKVQLRSVPNGTLSEERSFLVNASGTTEFDFLNVGVSASAGASEVFTAWANDSTSSATASSFNTKTRTVTVVSPPDLIFDRGHASGNLTDDASFVTVDAAGTNEVSITARLKNNVASGGASATTVVVYATVKTSGGTNYTDQFTVDSNTCTSATVVAQGTTTCVIHLTANAGSATLSALGNQPVDVNVTLSYKDENTESPGPGSGGRKEQITSAFTVDSVKPVFATVSLLDNSPTTTDAQGNPIQDFLLRQNFVNVSTTITEDNLVDWPDGVSLRVNRSFKNTNEVEIYPRSNLSFNGSTSTYYRNLSYSDLQNLAGTFFIDLQAVDKAGNSRTYANQPSRAHVNDVIPPFNETTDELKCNGAVCRTTTLEFGSQLNISLVVKDNYEVDPAEVDLNVIPPSGPTNTFAMGIHSDRDSRNNATYFKTITTDQEGTYTFSITYKDTTGNGATSTQVTVRAGDATSPTISELKVDAAPRVERKSNTSLQIAVKVTDNREVDNVNLELWHQNTSTGGETRINISIKTNGTAGTYTYTGTLAALGLTGQGRIVINVSANDTRGNWATLNFTTWNITIDHTPPRLLDPTAGHSITPKRFGRLQSFTIRADLTDFVNNSTKSVSVQFIQPGNTSFGDPVEIRVLDPANFTKINETSNNFSLNYKLPQTAPGGEWFYWFIVEDRAGNRLTIMNQSQSFTAVALGSKIVDANGVSIDQLDCTGLKSHQGNVNFTTTCRFFVENIGEINDTFYVYAIPNHWKNHSKLDNGQSAVSGHFYIANNRSVNRDTHVGNLTFVNASTRLMFPARNDTFGGRVFVFNNTSLMTAAAFAVHREEIRLNVSVTNLTEGADYLNFTVYVQSVNATELGVPEIQTTFVVNASVQLNTSLTLTPASQATPTPGGTAGSFRLIAGIGGDGAKTGIGDDVVSFGITPKRMSANYTTSTLANLFTVFRAEFRNVTNGNGTTSGTCPASLGGSNYLCYTYRNGTVINNTLILDNLSRSDDTAKRQIDLWITVPSDVVGGQFFLFEVTMKSNVDTVADDGDEEKTVDVNVTIPNVRGVALYNNTAGQTAPSDGVNETARVEVPIGATRSFNTLLVLNNTGNTPDTYLFKNDSVRTDYTGSAANWNMTFSHANLANGQITVQPRSTALINVTIRAPADAAVGKSAEWTVYAYVSGQVTFNNSAKVNATVVAPVIIVSDLQVTPATWPYNGSNWVNVSVVINIGAGLTIASATANVSYAGGTLGPFGLSYDPATGRNFTNLSFAGRTGRFDVFIWAITNAGDTNVSSVAQFTITEVPNAAPSLTAGLISPTGTFEFDPDTPINISAGNVTDNFEVAKVTLEITHGGSVVANLTMLRALDTGANATTHNGTYFCPFFAGTRTGGACADRNDSATPTMVLGAHGYRIFATDAVGNVVASAIFTFTVDDNSPPRITNVQWIGARVVAGQNTTGTNTTLNITAFIRDNVPNNLSLDSVKINITNAVTGIVRTANTTMNRTSSTDFWLTTAFNLTEVGSYTVRIWASDNGSRTSVYTATLVVSSNLPPDVPIASFKPACVTQATGCTRWGNATAIIELDVLDDDLTAANIAFSVDTGPGFAARTDVTKTAIAGGFHLKWRIPAALATGTVVKVRTAATDNASQVVEADHDEGFQFTVDASPPALTAPCLFVDEECQDADAPIPVVGPDSTIRFTAQDAHSGLKNLRYLVLPSSDDEPALADLLESSDPAEFALNDTELDLDLEDGARYIIYYTGEDNVGNRISVQKRSLELDQAGPILGSREVSGRVVSVSAFDIEGGVSGVTLWLGNNSTTLLQPFAMSFDEGTQNTWRLTLPATSNRLYYFFESTDGFGNRRSKFDVNDALFAYDAGDQPPILNIVSPVPGTVNGSVSVNWTAVDPEGGNVTSSVQVQNAAGAVVRVLLNNSDATRVRWDTTREANGNYTIVVVVSDGINQVSATVDVQVDNAPPPVSGGGVDKKLVAPGGQVLITVVVDPTAGVTSVTAIVRVGSTEEEVTLYDDGTHGDAIAGDGVFSALYAPAQKGAYRVDARVTLASGEQRDVPDVASFTVADEKPNLLGNLLLLLVLGAVTVLLAAYAAFVRWKP